LIQSLIPLSKLYKKRRMFKPLKTLHLVEKELLQLKKMIRRLLLLKRHLQVSLLLEEKEGLEN
jgi:hypothetical protein